ncbi:hypothetical protein STEG23_008578, partial [Scotinomys teguina]
SLGYPVRWFIYTMEYYAAEKNNDIMKFAGKWMELENVILSEGFLKRDMLTYSKAWTERKQDTLQVLGIFPDFKFTWDSGEQQDSATFDMLHPEKGEQRKIPSGLHHLRKLNNEQSISEQHRSPASSAEPPSECDYYPSHLLFILGSHKLRATVNRGLKFCIDSIHNLQRRKSNTKKMWIDSMKQTINS